MGPLHIYQYLKRYKSYNELMLAVNEILDNLSFGIEADKFESALKQIGDLLGFVSQRPDTEIRKDQIIYGVELTMNMFFLNEK